RIDGEAFDGGSGNDVEVVLGAQQFLPDLERGLVGRKAGEEFAVEVTFPDDYGSEEIAGKTAVFEVTVKSVSAPQVPELDDAFAETMDIEEGGVEALKVKVRES